MELLKNIEVNMFQKEFNVIVISKAIFELIKENLGMRSCGIIMRKIMNYGDSITRDHQN